MNILVRCVFRKRLVPVGEVPVQVYPILVYPMRPGPSIRIDRMDQKHGHVIGQMVGTSCLQPLQDRGCARCRFQSMRAAAEDNDP